MSVRKAAPKETYQKLYIIIFVLAGLLLISTALLVANRISNGRLSFAVGSAKITENRIEDRSAGSESEGVATFSNIGRKFPSIFAVATDTSPLSAWGNSLLLDTVSGEAGDTQAQENESIIELYKWNASDNEIFEVHNMLPGDRYTKYFGVKAFHSGDITIRFETQVSRNTKNFWDVLKLRVTDVNANEVLFDGSLKEMNDTVVERPFEKNSAMQTDVRYQMEFYMDTDVGNEHQGASMKVKLVWSTEDRGDLEPSPGNGFFDKFLAFFRTIFAFLRRMLYSLTGRAGG